ncbi:unnamed protein product [Orchesella dallaii]|uniref:U6 snRNA phosphodiesterase n=1 Tax=Orchesella dallaii TaxID=48710 RepID=A0ABP1S9U9_9HEXA
MDVASKSSGLTSLQIYDSDSENEDESTASCSISSKTTERSKSACGVGCKRPFVVDISVDTPRLPKHGRLDVTLPVPEIVLQMFSNSKGNGEDLSLSHNDPSLHMGRTRSFPHVRGNWASYLYLPCLNNTLMVELNGIIEETRKYCEDTLKIQILPVDDKHLSVSRTQSFRHHWIQEFVDNLRHTASGIETFELFFEEFHAYVNDEKTRTFIGIKVNATENLLRIVNTCDKCLADFQLDPYYEDASFHISVVWMLGDMKHLVEKKLIPYMNAKWLQVVESEPDLQILKVQQINFKTGNKLFQFPFAEKTKTQN